MQKKLIALALASAFAAPAFAATSNVDIGGTIDMSIDYLDADNGNINGGNVDVSSNSSNIFFKGAEDLGGGLSAIWQIQTYFSAGGTGNADTGVLGEAPKDGVSSGNTYVGLKGGFGTVLMGKHETPVKLISRAVDLFNNQIGDSRNLTNRAIGNTLTSLGGTTAFAGVVASGGFDLRTNNTIAYLTPDFSGFSGAVAYVTNVGDSGATTDSSVDAYSLMAKYENGPLYVGLGYQQHNLGNAWSALQDENVTRLAAAYTFGNFKFTGLYQWEDNLNIVTSTGGPAPVITATSTKRDVWGLGAAYKMDAWTFKGQYYNAGELDNTSNTGADMWAVGADYALSKRTTILAAYAETSNDNSATYSAFGGGHGDNPTTKAGGNPGGFSLAVRHAF